MLEFITFLLAPIGYAGLTLGAVQSARGQLHPALWRAIVIIIVTHVTMVWAIRYGWQFSEATRDGYAGFVMFHGALLAIITSVFVDARTARNLIVVAFGIVTLGAVGATFKFDVVERYRIPVIVCALAGIGGLFTAYRSRSTRPAH